MAIGANSWRRKLAFGAMKNPNPSWWLFFFSFFWSSCRKNGWAWIQLCKNVWPSSNSTALFYFLFLNAIPTGIRAIVQILTRNKFKLEFGLLGFEELRFFIVIFFKNLIQLEEGWPNLSSATFFSSFFLFPRVGIGMAILTMKNLGFSWQQTSWRTKVICGQSFFFFFLV